MNQIPPMHWPTCQPRAGWLTTNKSPTHQLINDHENKYFHFNTMVPYSMQVMQCKFVKYQCTTVVVVDNFDSKIRIDKLTSNAFREVGTTHTCLSLMVDINNNY